MGSSAVAARGIASVIHQIAINKTTAAIRVTKGLPESSSTKNRKNKNTAGPNQSPILLLMGTMMVVAEGESEVVVIVDLFVFVLSVISIVRVSRSKNLLQEVS